MTNLLTRPISPWWTVVAGTSGAVFSAGTIMVYSYGVVASAMGAEFGWSRDLLARNMTAFLIGSGIGTITLGWLVSRFGIRGPSALMAGSFGVLFAAVALLPAAPSIHLAAFLLIGFAGSACTPLPYSVAISGFFDTRRGLALGLVVAGTGVGGTLGPRIAQHLVSEHGWRAGFESIGLAATVVTVSGLVLFVRTPATVVTRRSSGTQAPNRVAALRLCFYNRDFWLIAFPILAVSVATFGAMASLVPLFKDAGISSTMIAGALSSAALCSWVGRLIIGYLLDKIFAPFVCAAIFSCAAMGLLLLTTGSSALHIYAGAAMVALAMGTEADFVTYLVSRYFRLIEYSRVVGLIWVVWAWGGGVGTYLANRSFGSFGSYEPAFYGFVCLLLVGAVVVVTLGPYRSGGQGSLTRSPTVTPNSTASKSTLDQLTSIGVTRRGGPHAPCNERIDHLTSMEDVRSF